MEENVLVVKYGEVAMRGNNRMLFVNKLVDAIRRNIDPIGTFYVVKEQGRLIVECREGTMDFEAVIPRVLCVLGLVGVCPGVKTTDQSLEALCGLSLRHMMEMVGQKQTTFKVVTKRSDKRFPLPSNEVSARIGEYLIEHMDNLTVDVHQPEITLYVELRNDAYVYSKLIKGYGGLPAGSSGRAVALLSGGIDSPVAAWMMAKRGIEVSAVYFHSPPYTSERAKQKVVDLAERIAWFMGGMRLYVVPFTEVQLYLLENVPEDKLTIHLKRAMMRVAEQIAEKEKGLALITGDSVGQVASQTLHGLHAINAAVKGMPVLRPLAGMDKQEIVNIAREIGTFDISIRPYEDCCTIFVAKYPETRPKTNVIEKIESHLTQLDEKLQKAFEEAELITL